MAETFSDEILMRFADGELDEATAARLERALAADDALMVRLALFTETRAASKAALQPLLDEPVPEKLRAAVEAIGRTQEGVGCSGERRRFPRRRRFACRFLAVAAGGLIGRSADWRGRGILDRRPVWNVGHRASKSQA